MKRMLSIVRQRGQLRVASDDSLCANAGTNFSASAPDTLRLHLGQRSSPRPNSACVARRSAKPTLFFRPTQHRPPAVLRTTALVVVPPELPNQPGRLFQASSRRKNGVLIDLTYARTPGELRRASCPWCEPLSGPRTRAASLSRASGPRRSAASG